MPDPKRPRKAEPKPAFEVVEEEDFEVVDEEPTLAEEVKPARKSRRADPEPRDDRDEDDEPRSRPKKKKKKKRTFAPTQDDLDQEERDAALRHFEFTVPAAILGVGLLLTFVGAFGATKVGAFATLLITLVGIVVGIPITIACLMLIGILMGIEYGRIGPAILKIAAITSMVNGVYFLGAWAHLPVFLVFPIGCIIAFALFMSQFDLDTWETNVSVGALNVLSFFGKILLFMFLIAMSSKGDRDRDRDNDRDVDPPPADTQKDRERGPGPGPVEPPPGQDERGE